MLCSSPVHQLICSNFFLQSTYKSHGLGRAKLEPSQVWRLWPGLGFEKAEAASGQAKAAAFRPSRAGTALAINSGLGYCIYHRIASSQPFSMIIFALHSRFKCEQNVCLNVKNCHVLHIFNFGHETIVSTIEQPILNRF